MSPAGVEILTQRGHTIYVEHEAGVGAGFSDQEYEKAGAHLAYSGEEVFARADLLLKMARPFKSEMSWLKEGAILAGFLHLASAKRDKIDVLISKKITSLAYEAIQHVDGSLPVLRPFSQIGGLMAAQISARLLQNNWGGKGILLGGVPGVPPAEVVVLGGGVVGSYATQGFIGLGAHVTVLDLSMAALQRIADRFPGVTTMISTKRNIERSTAYADVLVGAVLVPGQRAPILVTREMVAAMKPRSVIVDVSIDEGGCVETSRPTTHEHPTYIEEGITHCAVPNLPGVVARTSTHAFVNSALPYILEVAAHGVDKAMEMHPAVESGIVTYQGEFRQMERFSAHEEVDDGLD
jgi:alanine dehydrogenase